MRNIRCGTRDIWAVVPIKELKAAKQRLASTLSMHQREAIVLAMAEDVLSALSVADLEGIVVVTRDKKVSTVAKRYGARVVVDPEDGQSQAVNSVLSLLAQEGKRATIVLPGDIPLLSPREIHELVDACESDNTFAIVPSHDQMGSNAVLCSPPDLMRLEFGPDSFSQHLRKAKASGLSPKIVRLAGVALDIDHPADLYSLVRTGSETRTYSLVSKFLCAPQLRAS